MKNYLSGNTFFRKVYQNKITIILLFFLLAVGLFLRTRFGTDYYTLGDESVRDASVALVGAREIQFPLVGPFSSHGPFTFGPWYYYQLILSYWVIPSLWAPWISLTIFSLLLILVSYKIGVLIQDKYLGYIAAFLAAISIAQLDASRFLSNPYPIGFLASVAMLLAIQIYQDKKSRWKSFLWGILTGVAISYHYQSVWLLTLLIFSLSNIKKYFRVLLWYGIGLAIATLPTLFFELNNHWFTTRNILRYLQYDQYTIYVPNRWLTYLTDFTPRFLGSVLGTFFPLTVAIIFLAAFVFARDFLRRKLPKELFYLLISATIIFVGMRYYRGERSFGYFQFFHVYIFIVVAYMVRNLFTKYKNIIAFILCALFLTSALVWQSKHFAKDLKNYKAFNVIGELEEKWPNEKYDWYFCKPPLREPTEAASFFYDYHGRLSQNGRKMAYFDSDRNCTFPLDEETTARLKEEEIVSLQNKLYPVIQLREERLIDLSYASHGALAKNNWSRIDPKIISDSVTRWWFDEKP